ncbi:flagellar biosynthetic protein FliR [Paeniglutamicibacter kerguelensis]|uniref:Flagellar biosynthetic protein FliR n=1 Tax=Paeniglutamicibacter kerguelensis TaxID=254788 RepID=A0ABS4XEE4_9MICC|nr:flagellar biosynthetic protein FliR [Paeniglutamicibacter kerguelensis]MBP2386839.1 flagellar biosynthetic protein FliR [Paeniglutamicibacter kerguelensis]
MQAVLPLGNLEAMLLAAVRMTAFIIIAPPFSYNAIPGRIKATLAVGLALAVTPRLSAGYQPQDTGPFLASVVLELVTGASLGFMVFLLFSAVQSAGGLIDLFGGFAMAQGFDPQSMVNGAQFSRYFHWAALALLVSSDGYQLVLAGLFRSFDAIPLGGVIAMDAVAENLVRGVEQMFVSAIQIAGPLLVVLVLADIGLGLLTRAAPALNAFAMGFPLKIFLTLSLAGTVFVLLPSVVAALVRQSLKAIGTVLGA